MRRGISRHSPPLSAGNSGTRAGNGQTEANETFSPRRKVAQKNSIVSIYRETGDGIVVNVFVQPRASRNQVAGRHGEALKLRLTAPPVEGAANKMCIAFLAEILGVPKSTLEIVAGHASRSKQVLVRSTADRSQADLKKIAQRLVPGCVF